MEFKGKIKAIYDQFEGKPLMTKPLKGKPMPFHRMSVILTDGKELVFNIFLGNLHTIIFDTLHLIQGDFIKGTTDNKNGYENLVTIERDGQASAKSFEDAMPKVPDQKEEVIKKMHEENHNVYWLQLAWDILKESQKQGEQVVFKTANDYIDAIIKDVKVLSEKLRKELG